MSTGTEDMVSAYHKIGHTLAVSVGMPLAYILGGLDVSSSKIFILVCMMILIEVVVGFLAWILCKKN